MGYSLTIKEGKEVGREFTFDQPEVSIGRTAENDIVLYDPGVSRKHVVIRNEGGRLVVQDQGSANGTQVNGSPVVEGELQTGDLLGVGPVVFSVDVGRDEGSTRIVDPSTLAPPAPPASKKGLPKATDDQRKKATDVRPAPGKIVPSRSPPPSKRAAPVPLSASERARLKRQAISLPAKIRLFLMDKPPAVRYGIFGGAGVFVLGLLFGLLSLRGGSGGVVGLNLSPQDQETFQLGDGPSQDVYGMGANLGVTVVTPGELKLGFEYSDTIPQVYILQFESKGVESKDEVDVSLNGVHVGNVNAGMGDYTKIQKIKLPKKYLTKGPNILVFDNTRNPVGGGNETWAIYKARLLVKALPQGTTTELLRNAKDMYTRAEKLFQEKDLASANRFEAWMALYKAQLYLEAIDPKPDLYQMVLQTYRDVEKDLELMCNRVFLTAKKFEELRNFTASLNEYKSGLLRFPKDDHPCHTRLREAIDVYGNTPKEED